MNLQTIRRQVLIAGGMLLILLILSNCGPLKKIRSFKKVEKESVPEPRQSYTCKRIVDQIKIDGLLDEVSWKSAEIMNLVTIKNVEGKVQYGERDGGHKTTAKVLWDDSYLYIGFKVEDKDIWATITEHDRDLSSEEVVEIFIDPEGGQVTYGEIQVNPLNTLFDQYVIWCKKGAVWMDYWADSSPRGTSDIKTGVNVVGTVKKRDDRDKYWTAELAIPLHLFLTARSLPPRAGQKWRLNLTAINYPQDGPGEFVTWAKLGPKFFHDPKNFAEIVFSNDYVAEVEVIKSPKAISSFDTLKGISFSTSDQVKILSTQPSPEEKHEGNSSLETTIQFNRGWGRFDINFKDKPVLPENGELALWVKGDPESNAKIHYEMVDSSGETYVGTLTYAINWPEWKEVRGIVSKAQLNKNKKDKVIDFPVRLTKLYLYSRKVSEDTFYFDDLRFNRIELRLVK